MAENNKIGALWKKMGKNGKEMLNGDITIQGQKYKIVCFPNDYKKEGDNKPEYNVLLSSDTFAEKKAEIIQNTKPIPDDDLPF